MQGHRRALAALGLAAIMLAGCGSTDEPRLLNLASNDRGGPDEFSIVPNKPLQQPQTYAQLPPPVPGAANLADPTPEADAVLALGGTPGAGVGDPALVSYATRYGVAPDIRTRLAAADLEFRRENRGLLLERVLNKNVYFDAYEPLSLDQRAELLRFRRAGVRTPSAPPAPVE